VNVCLLFASVLKFASSLWRSKLNRTWTRGTRDSICDPACLPHAMENCADVPFHANQLQMYAGETISKMYAGIVTPFMLAMRGMPLVAFEKVTGGPDSKYAKLYSAYHKAYLSLRSTNGSFRQPLLYIIRNARQFTAFTTYLWVEGGLQPVVAISTGMVFFLNYEELCFVLGHELGHVMRSHVSQFYRLGANILLAQQLLVPRLALCVSQTCKATLPDAMLVTRLFVWIGCKAFMKAHSRACEVTADRYGLVSVSRDINDKRRALEVSVKLFCKFDDVQKSQGLFVRNSWLIDPHGYLNYSRRQRDRPAGLTTLIKRWLLSHPENFLRADELRLWADCGLPPKRLRHKVLSTLTFGAL